MQLRKVCLLRFEVGAPEVYVGGPREFLRIPQKHRLETVGRKNPMEEHQDLIHLSPLVRRILEDYELPLQGYHGIAHWARVLINGRRVAEESGGCLEVVTLFALFHDARRVNEGTDPDHGQRGADLAAELRDDWFELDDSQFKLLYRACVGHTHERTHPNVTIQCCWDADRLDLGRVGVLPDPNRLCTDFAKLEETILWADLRAAANETPSFVTEAWGLLD